MLRYIIGNRLKDMPSKEAKFFSGQNIFQHKDFRSVKHKNESLHHKMIAEADGVVLHNWSDVVYSDKKSLKSMPVGGVAVWCIYEMGSYFCPMYQSARFPDEHPEKITLPLICHVLCRFYPEQPDRLSRELANTAKYYVIHKSSRSLDGSIDPIHFDSLRRFVQLIGN